VAYSPCWLLASIADAGQVGDSLVDCYEWERPIVDRDGGKVREVVMSRKGISRDARVISALYIAASASDVLASRMPMNPPRVGVISGNSAPDQRDNVE